ncbi:MAG TPA: hypothetical protein VL863_10740, partial [bacterium]|nr:hypothetical protein [bacterium]
MTTPVPVMPAPDPFPQTAGDDLKQSLYTLIARQPFFQGMNAHQLQLLADSALEMKFETGQKIFESGS